MALSKDYKEGYKKALTEIFNTYTHEARGTLTECYARETTSDYDQGWDKCFEAFVDVAGELEEALNNG